MRVVGDRFKLHSERQKVGNIWIFKKVTRYLDVPISMVLEEVSKSYKLMFYLRYDISRNIGVLTHRLEYGEFKVSGYNVTGNVDCVVFHEDTAIDFDTIMKVDKMTLKEAIEYLKHFNFEPKTLVTPLGTVSL